MARILLIDDDLDLSFLTEKALLKQGHEVLVSHEAMSGIKEAVLRKPDLILMDVMMPGMTGAEAVQKLQQNPASKNIPVVFLTALIMKDDDPSKESGIKVAGQNYRALGKPYEISDLLQLVENILS